MFDRREEEKASVFRRLSESSANGLGVKRKRPLCRDEIVRDDVAEIRGFGCGSTRFCNRSWFFKFLEFAFMFNRPNFGSIRSRAPSKFGAHPPSVRDVDAYAVAEPLSAVQKLFFDEAELDECACGVVPGRGTYTE